MSYSSKIQVSEPLYYSTDDESINCFKLDGVLMFNDNGYERIIDFLEDDNFYVDTHAPMIIKSINNFTPTEDFYILKNHSWNENFGFVIVSNTSSATANANFYLNIIIGDTNYNINNNLTIPLSYDYCRPGQNSGLYLQSLKLNNKKKMFTMNGAASPNYAAGHIFFWKDINGKDIIIISQGSILIYINPVKGICQKFNSIYYQGINYTINYDILIPLQPDGTTESELPNMKIDDLYLIIYSSYPIANYQYKTYKGKKFTIISNQVNQNGNIKIAVDTTSVAD